LRLGDVVTLALDRRVRVIEVAGFRERRGGAGDAAATYREISAGTPPKT
jgi:ribosome-associated heat shock protein Hsp15